LESSPRPNHRVVRLDEIEAIPIPGALLWRPVRGILGVRVFGIASFEAPAIVDGGRDDSPGVLYADGLTG
jgi:hypothetical protein